MSIKIDLTNHRDKFAKNSLELALYEKVNIIFGKNGTGKTAIADEIDEQFSDNYNVCIFNPSLTLRGLM